jgi:hypothetical protein
MHFYLPRRYRRQLYFPPGLLALAGLLWLGCVAVSAHSDRLKKRVVMQLTMPPAHITPGSPFYGATSPVSLSARELNSFRPWHIVQLTGCAGVDLQTKNKLLNNIRSIAADSGHAGGVRIEFASTARYKELIYALDLMDREKARRYWLDIKHKPTTLYTFTEVRLRSDPVNFICGNQYANRQFSIPIQSLPFWTRFDDWITDFWDFSWIRTWLQSLRTAEWRASVWLLTAIGAVGSWRIIQTWRRA